MIDSFKGFVAPGSQVRRARALLAEVAEMDDEPVRAKKADDSAPGCGEGLGLCGARDWKGSTCALPDGHRDEVAITWRW